MATVTYQQFYYLPDDEFIELEGLNAYFSIIKITICIKMRCIVLNAYNAN